MREEEARGNNWPPGVSTSDLSQPSEDLAKSSCIVAMLWSLNLLSQVQKDFFQYDPFN